MDDPKNAPPGTGIKQRIFENVTTYSDDDVDAQQEVAQIRKMLEANPDSPDLKEWLAFKLYSAGEYDEAILIYEDLIRRQHRAVNQHFYLANAYSKKGLLEKAIESWRIVATTIPNEVKGQKAAARLEKALKERDGA